MNLSLHTSQGLGAVQGVCDDPYPAHSLNLTTADSANLLPLKPFQCLLMVHEPWLMVNLESTAVWVDNLYLKVAKAEALPEMDIISVGHEWLQGRRSSPANVYVTGVTFHAEGRGTAAAIAARKGFTAVLVEGVFLQFLSSCRANRRCGPGCCGASQAHSLYPV